jgi:hypothetical protein
MSPGQLGHGATAPIAAYLDHSLVCLIYVHDLHKFLTVSQDAGPRARVLSQYLDEQGPNVSGFLEEGRGSRPGRHVYVGSFRFLDPPHATS